MNNKQLLDYFVAHSPCKVKICVDRNHSSTCKRCQICNYGCYLKCISIRFEAPVKHQLTTFIHEFAHFYIDRIIDDKKHDLHSIASAMCEEREEEIAELVVMMWLKRNKKFFFSDWFVNWPLVIQWYFKVINEDDLQVAEKIFTHVQLMTVYAENSIDCKVVAILD